MGESEFGFAGFFGLSGGLPSFSVGVSSLSFCGFTVYDCLEAVLSADSGGIFCLWIAAV